VPSDQHTGWLMNSAFDRPGSTPDVPDAPDEVGAPERRTPERSDTWLNLDNASDEELLSFLGLDRPDRGEDGPQAASSGWPALRDKVLAAEESS
jgi:hypothetical protein